MESRPSGISGSAGDAFVNQINPELCPVCQQIVTTMTLYLKDRKPATEAEILAAAGKITSARRKTRKGGRPKELRKCKGCGLRLGVREMAAHKCEGKT